MMILSHISPVENMNRWYLVAVQPTLLDAHAVIVAWGRRDNDFQHWRAIPVDTAERAQELAEWIVNKKLRRGYRAYSSR